LVLAENGDFKDVWRWLEAGGGHLLCQSAEAWEPCACCMQNDGQNEQFLYLGVKEME